MYGGHTWGGGGGQICSVWECRFFSPTKRIPRPPNVENPGCMTKHAKTVNILATTIFLKKQKNNFFVCSFCGQNIDPGDDYIKLGYN